MTELNEKNAPQLHEDQWLLTLTKFPPVVRAETMLRESLRDGWIMGEHPVRFLRGNDHG
jgi:hypothetical protein